MKPYRFLPDDNQEIPEELVDVEPIPTEDGLHGVKPYHQEMPKCPQCSGPTRYPLCGPCSAKHYGFPNNKSIPFVRLKMYWKTKRKGKNNRGSTLSSWRKKEDVQGLDT